MNRRLRLSLGAVSVLLYVFLYAPLAVVVLHSFNRAKHGGAWQGFTTDWYGVLLHNDVALHATGITLALAAMSTTISTLLGTSLALGLQRKKFPGQRFAEWTLQGLIVVPDIVMAIGLLLFYALVRQWLGGFEPGLFTMTLAHVTFQIPFVTLVVRARLAGLDPSLAEAARDLGATTLPILIYSSVKRGLTPDINALSALLVLVSVVATTMVMLLQRRRVS